METNAQFEALLRWLAEAQRTLLETADHLGTVIQEYGHTLEVQPRFERVALATVMGQPPGTWAMNIALAPNPETPFPSLAWFAEKFGEWVVPARKGFPSTASAIFTVAMSDTFLSRIIAELPAEVAVDVCPSRLIVSVQDMSKLA